jgi:hypothetical protein
LTFVLSVGILASIYAGDFQISLLTSVIGLVIALPFDLVYIMAIGNMVHEDRFGAAFDFSKIFGLIRKIGWSKYISYIAVFAIIGFLLGIIAQLGTLMRISFGLGWGVIGIILTVLVEIYLIIYQGRYIGLVYRKGNFIAKNDGEFDDNSEFKENKDTGTA